MKKLYDKPSLVIQCLIVLDVLFLQLAVSFGLINTSNIPFNLFYFGFLDVHYYLYAALGIYLIYTFIKKKRLYSVLLFLQGAGVLVSILYMLPYLRGFSGALVFKIFFIQPYLIAVVICVLILLFKKLSFNAEKSAKEA